MSTHIPKPTTESFPMLLCPECQNGKTNICIGVALDPATDDFVECSTQVQTIFEQEENN